MIFFLISDILKYLFVVRNLDIFKIGNSFVTEDLIACISHLIGHVLLDKTIVKRKW